MTLEKCHKLMGLIEAGRYERVADELEHLDAVDVVTFCHFIGLWDDEYNAEYILQNLIHLLGGKKVIQ